MDHSLEHSKDHSMDHHQQQHRRSRHSITALLLNQVAQRGVHVWHCDGNWQHKDRMWSAVTRVYASASAFVFPLDVDELITLPSDINNDNTTGSLVWDAPHLYRALTQLPAQGKPYKMEHAEPIPADCHYHYHYHNNQLFGVGSSKVCQLTHVVRRRPEDRWSCTDKTFSRGMDFLETDTGNHCLMTPHIRALLPPGKPPYYAAAGCLAYGLARYYDTSNVVLLHTQRLDFGDWLLHGWRGASSRGYTLPRQHRNCSSTHGQSHHYCRTWQQMRATQWQLETLQRALYHREHCPAAAAALLLQPTTTQSGSLVTSVFAHGCANGA